MPNSSLAIAGTDALASEYNNLRKDIIQGALVYGGASAVGTDAYAITIDAQYTALTDGSFFLFTADVANTGACTLQINALVAKTIKKLDDKDLQTGDIVAGMKVLITYDGTDDVFKMLSLPASLTFTKSLTAGENVDGSTTPQAVYVSDGTNSRTSGRYYLADGNDNTNSDSSKFFGFAKGNITTGNTDDIFYKDIVAGFTGLTVGADYFLSDTAGSIATTPGTKEVKIGKAISATEILIERNTSSFVYGVSMVASSTTQNIDTTFEIGFRANVIEIQYSLHGYANADAYSVGIARFHGTTLQSVFASLVNRSSGAAVEFSSAAFPAEPRVVGAGGTALDVVLSVAAVTDTSITVRVAFIATGAPASKTSYFATTAFK